MKVLSVGEILWDIFADREFLGGAPLNVCSNLQRCGDTAVLLSVVGTDDRGRRALQSMQTLGLTTDFVQTTQELPTGTARVETNTRGEPAFSIERPTAFDTMTLSADNEGSLIHFAPDWLYMGTLLQVQPRMEALVQTLRLHLPGVRCFYDMNLRSGHWNLDLVERLCQAASVLKLNEDEAELLAGLTGFTDTAFSLESFCVHWAKRFELDLICVTLGANGCFVFAHGTTRQFSGTTIQVSDTVGAGDAFAAAFLHGYHRQWPIARCAALANALGALVASRPGATPVWRMEECEQLAAQLLRTADYTLTPLSDASAAG